MIIWKFPLEVTDWQIVKMPIGAKILDVQVQHGGICLWALCDENAEKESRHFLIFGTGEGNLPDYPGEYIATVQKEGGSLIWHIFEQINP